MRLIDADALIEFCAERWIPLNIDAVNMQPTIQQVATDINVGDTISRQAAIDEITEYGSGNTIYMSVVELKRRIEQLPTAQSERQKGEWLADNRPGGGFWVCSCCKFPSEAFAANVLYKFCPNCGADMRGGQNG